MRIVIIIVLLSAVVLNAAVKVPVLLWKNNYGGTGAETGRAIINDRNGGFAITGSMPSLSSGTDTYINYLLRITQNGTLLSLKTYGKGAGYTSGNDLAQTQDGNYYIAGTVPFTSSTYQSPYNHIFALKLSATGDSLWLRPTPDNFYNDDYESGYAVTALADGGCLCVGTSWAPTISSSYNVVRAMRLSSNNGVVWDSLYSTGVSQQCQGYAVTQASAGGFVLAGDRYFYMDDNYRQALVIRVDNTGKTLWRRLYGTTRMESIKGVVEADNGSFVFAAQSNPSTDTYKNYCIWLVKIAANGDTLWTRMFSDTCMMQPTRLIKSADHGFFMIGVSGGNGAYGINVLALKTDSLGIEQWRYVYDGGSVENAYGATEADSGEFVFTGYASYAGKSNDILAGRIGLRSFPEFTGPKEAVVFGYAGQTLTYLPTVSAGNAEDTIRFSCLIPAGATGLQLDSVSGQLTYSAPTGFYGIGRVEITARNRWGLQSRQGVNFVIGQSSTNRTIIQSFRPAGDTAVDKGYQLPFGFQMSQWGNPVFNCTWSLNGDSATVGTNYYLRTDTLPELADTIACRITIDTGVYQHRWIISLRPTLIAPANAQQVSNGFFFRWLALRDRNTGTLPLYRLSLSYDSLFQKVFATADSLHDTSFLASRFDTLLRAPVFTPIFWRVYRYGISGKVDTSRFRCFILNPATTFTNVPKADIPKQFGATGILYRENAITMTLMIPDNHSHVSADVSLRLYDLRGRTVAHHSLSLVEPGYYPVTIKIPGNNSRKKTNSFYILVVSRQIPGQKSAGSIMRYKVPSAL